MSYQTQCSAFSTKLIVVVLELLLPQASNDGNEGGWKVPEAFSNLKEQKWW